MRLIRIALDGKAELLGKVDLNTPLDSIHPYDMSRFISSVGIDGNIIYAATRSAGIVVFPLDGSSGRRIDTTNGLPSNIVNSAACLDGKLYAGVGDGYLISYDLKQERCEVIASSRRKDKRSPFDNQEPFQVPMMRSDPKRGRIVFVIDHTLWQIRPADGNISEVLDLYTCQPYDRTSRMNASYLQWASSLRGDRVMLGSAFHAVELDLGSNTALCIHRPSQGTPRIWPPHLLVSGSLWSADSFARLSLKDQTQQLFPPFDGSATPFNPSQCLELVNGGKQVLAGDDQSLWLLELKP